MERLKQVSEEVHDPRRDYGNKRHKLASILGIGLCSEICGGEGFDAMEEFGETRREWLERYFELPNGTPCADTFRRVFERLDSKELLKCLNNWLEKELLMQSGGRSVNIDGKTMRGSGEIEEGLTPYHVVSAWVDEYEMVLGQLETEGKSSEITAIPALLDMIDVRGDIVSIDAMGCQKEIAAKIRGKGADYVLAVKDNHPTLHEDIREYFQWAEREPDRISSDIWRGDIEKGHGRIERREITTITDVSWLRRVGEWADLNTIIRYRCTHYAGEETSCTDRYYISSFETTPEQFGYLVRNHWSIENRLHWMLDVLFCEDASKVSKGFSPLNLSVLRKVALSCLQRAPTPMKISVRRKMMRTALDPDFLHLVLFGG